ncbi:hypothetical protein ETF27_01980 [Prevotella brunnea]|uniref:Uncharacterized protein n=1 Tax=Prevotella brunnea TaxID=2508867 RepID=A0A5C8GMR6_9BACT|nr:hypothetical protein [Prevotella brunnea]MDR0185490.1 hypothetical protein [Prevotella brunnea]TXJ63036.1 hypothetical protein ETF27_01980 [Prevotella brunnea]
MAWGNILIHDDTQANAPKAETTQGKIFHFACLFPQAIQTTMRDTPIGTRARYFCKDKQKTSNSQFIA